jgi:HSP20 family molecular chaperone IbpA
MVKLMMPIEAEKNAVFLGFTQDNVLFTRFDEYETDDALVFCCRMPGVELVDIETALEAGELVIRGQVRVPAGRTETQASPDALHFFRSFPVGHQFAPDQISAKFKDGLLTVRLPKVVSRKIQRAGFRRLPASWSRINVTTPFLSSRTSR